MNRRLALLRPAGAAGIHMAVMGAAFGIFAVSLLAQSARWHRTPAYHNLLLIMSAGSWGILFALTALFLLAAAFRDRPEWLAYTAVLLAFMLSTCWDIAFLVRWFTNSATTPETWVSWTVFDYVLLRAGALISRERSQQAPARQGDGHG